MQPCRRPEGEIAPSLNLTINHLLEFPEEPMPVFTDEP